MFGQYLVLALVVMRHHTNTVHLSRPIGPSVVHLALCALCAMTWQWLRARRRGRVLFVTIHAPPQSATLQKRADRKTEPATSLVQLVRDKVPALGPDARFDGVWWLPGYMSCRVPVRRPERS